MIDMSKAGELKAFSLEFTGFFIAFSLFAFCLAKALLSCLIVFHGVVSQTFVQHKRGNVGGLFKLAVR